MLFFFGADVGSTRLWNSMWSLTQAFVRGLVQDQLALSRMALFFVSGGGEAGGSFMILCCFFLNLLQR